MAYSLETKCILDISESHSFAERHVALGYMLRASQVDRYI